MAYILVFTVQYLCSSFARVLLEGMGGMFLQRDEKYVTVVGNCGSSQAAGFSI